MRKISQVRYIDFPQKNKNGDNFFPGFPVFFVEYKFFVDGCRKILYIIKSQHYKKIKKEQDI